MDYVIFDALRDCELERVAITYDIWCKWSIHAEKRAHDHFPHDMTKGFLRLERRGFIPKLHIYGHGIECRTQYSLNYHPGLGRTDGESVERDWAAIVQAALQTGEMNAGTRHGTLDDHWADKNFCRIIGLSECTLVKCVVDAYLLSEDLLLRWLQKAISWSNVQGTAVAELERGIPVVKLVQWKKMVAAWEVDHSSPDPYEEREEGQLHTYRIAASH
jgi:hypothetical protein